MDPYLLVILKMIIHNTSILLSLNGMTIIIMENTRRTRWTCENDNIEIEEKIVL